MPLSADALVIGGGIVGAFAALDLAGSGRKVVWLHPGDEPGSATPASGAMLGVLGEVTAHDNSAALDLRRAAATRWRELWDGLGETRRGEGTVVVGCSRYPSDARNLSAILDAAMPGEAEHVDPGDVRGLRPARDSTTSFALFLPQERWISSTGVLAEIKRRIPPHPVRAVKLEVEGDAVTGATTADGSTIVAEEVVMCTGASTELLSASALPTDLLPSMMFAKGTGVLLKHGGASAPEHVVRTPNRAFACGLHIVPQQDTLAYIGATNRASRLPHVLGQGTSDEITGLLTDAASQINTDIRAWNVVGLRWGHRPLPVDGNPVCGRTELRGLSAITGTYRDGVLLAPYLSDLLVKELDGAPPHPSLTPTRRTPVFDPAEVFEAGVEDLAELLTTPAWAERVRTILASLGTLAISSDPKATEARQNFRRYLSRYGRAEMIPEALVELESDLR